MKHHLYKINRSQCTWSPVTTVQDRVVGGTASQQDDIAEDIADEVVAEEAYHCRG